MSGLTLTEMPFHHVLDRDAFSTASHLQRPKSHCQNIWGVCLVRACASSQEIFFLPTGDMGVELSIPDMFVDDVNRLLPAWASSHAIQGEVLHEEQAEGRSATDLDGPSLPLSPDGVDGPSMDVEAAPQGASAHPPGPCGRMMPKSFTIAGLQHISHNLLQDVHSSMQHWETFHAQLKVLEGFLRIPERRSRFIVTHLKGSVFEKEEHLFTGHFSEALYEHRWRNIIDFLLHAQKLLPILAATWDPSKFLKGVDTAGHSKTAQAKAAAVQEALGMKQCWGWTQKQ